MRKNSLKTSCLLTLSIIFASNVYAAGTVGPAGPKGATGPAGPQGIQGPVGPAGPKGATGAQGPAGPKGATGAQGPAGATGAVGATGPSGATGATGPQGLTGAQGPVGLAGASGQNINPLQLAMNKWSANPVNPIFVGATPEQMVFDGDNIWVANSYGQSISKIRASDGVVLGTYSVGPYPRGIAYDGSYIWVTTENSNPSMIMPLFCDIFKFLLLENII